MFLPKFNANDCKSHRGDPSQTRLPELRINNQSDQSALSFLNPSAVCPVSTAPPPADLGPRTGSRTAEAPPGVRLRSPPTLSGRPDRLFPGVYVNELTSLAVLRAPLRLPAEVRTSTTLMTFEETLPTLILT